MLTLKSLFFNAAEAQSIVVMEPEVEDFSQSSSAAQTPSTGEATSTPNGHGSSSPGSLSSGPCSREEANSTVPEEASPLREVEIFFSTFVTIFLAEIGDKTQVTTLLMSAESHAPWIVFLGAGSALVLTSLLGVLVGRWLSSRVSPQTLETLTGGILLFIAVLLLWDVIHL